MSQSNDGGVARATEASASALLTRWWRVMDLNVGIISLPVAATIFAIVCIYVRIGDVPSDILMNIAVLTTGGFLCAEAGKRIPILGKLGFAAILATFAPSYLAQAGILPAALVRSVSAFTDTSNILYLFVASIIVGSILGMDRRLLVSGFLKVFVPLIAGSVLAAAVGCAVGVALGLGFSHTLFKIVVPVMAGGVGEGAIPLSIGYAQISHQPQGQLFAEVLPPIMLSSLTAIVFAGILNFVGKHRPDLTGRSGLQIGEHDQPLTGADAMSPASSPVDVGSAVVMVVAIFLLGALAQRLWNWPGPVVMLALAVLMKLGRVASPRLERGAYANYQFFSACVTYPLLFAIGVAKTPWDSLIAALTLQTIVTIVATVATLIATGFVTAKFMRLYPIDAAIVNACHCGQGGTGSVAILTAGDRMQLMPFAQIATRIGGAITVTCALSLFARMS